MKIRKVTMKTEVASWPSSVSAEAWQKIPGTVRHEIARVWEVCGPFEWIALGYLAFSSALVAIFSRNLAHPVRLIAAQTFAALLILVLCFVYMRSKERSVRIGERFATKFWRFWRHWYPHLFFLFCFEELGDLVHLVNPGWEDTKLIAFDYWLTGAHPALWLEQFANPVRNDFFQFTYITYFTYLLIVGGMLYYRRDWKGYWATMTYSAAGYVIGYFIAMMFPVESPWFSMAGMWHGDLHGGPFTYAINFIEHFGRVRGAAFPSEHVAGSVAALWGAWKHRRWLFWTLLPFVACMCFSTIWGRYHYIADVFAGIMTGTLGYTLGSWLLRSNAAENRVKWEIVPQKAESFAD